MSYSCLDTGHHAFCSHDCCGDSEACATEDPIGARGSLRHVQPYDPPPATGLLAVVFAIVGGPIPRPYERERARWEARCRQVPEPVLFDRAHLPKTSPSPAVLWQGRARP